MCISKAAEPHIRKIEWISGEGKLRRAKKILPSTVGGGLSCGNHPFEVLTCVAYLGK
jgi:hypothetical protein